MYEYIWCMKSYVWIHTKILWTSQTLLEGIFRKEYCRLEVIASGRCVVSQNCFQTNQTALINSSQFKLITNRKWILQSSPVLLWLRQCQRFKVKWRCVYEQLGKNNLDGVGVPSNIILNWHKIVSIVSFWFWIFLVYSSFGLELQNYRQALKILLIGSPWQNFQDLNNLRKIFRIWIICGTLFNQQEPTTKPSKRTLSTKLLMALQEWPDVTVDKGKVTDVVDTMVAVVPADKAVDWATQVSPKLQKWVSARN